MKVQITEIKSRKIVGVYPVVLKGMNFRPTYDELYTEAWRCAVEDGLVDEANSDNYALNVLLDSWEELINNKPIDTSMRPEIKEAHKHSFKNKDEILASEICGCFGCLAIMNPTEITWFVEEQEVDGKKLSTAMCPHCNIDTVIGSSSGYPITRDFLMEMNHHWCGDSAEE